MVCPKCGSSNVKIKLRSAGTSSRTSYYKTMASGWLVPSGVRKYSSKRNHQSVALCQKCGHHWVVEDGTPKGCAFYLGCLLVWPIALGVWLYNGPLSKLDKWLRLLIIIGPWIVFGLYANWDIKHNPPEPTPASAPTRWSAEYTELSEFEYYIDGDALHLKEYTGRSRMVNIAPVYTVDGRELPVVSLDGTFRSSRADSVIVPEGVTQISAYTFNGVEYLYLPETLSDFSGWEYFRDVQKLYYGGTESEWEQLFNDNRARLDVTEIICGVSISELLSDTP